MTEKINLESILFLDIETVGAVASYQQLDPKMKSFWDKKAESFKKEPEDSPEKLYQKAGIYAEFGKIVCISVAFFKDGLLRIKSFANNDEKTVLQEFAHLLNAYFYKPHHRLCAHNGKEFDFPYLCRRMLINALPLPSILNVAGKKPWETPFLDTLELWKFGDYKHYTALDLLAAIFGIPSPKDDIDGSMVHTTYWEHNDLVRIAEYCEKDVLTVAQLYRCYNGLELLSEDKIVFVKS
ncbi:MAG: 3'-5' exonuclease [Lentimicrobiaceae bacterium]|nr:3'-5' exonuclease [Lentimicrobiaceae bacterium]